MRYLLLFLLGLKVVLNALVEILVLLPRLHHEHPTSDTLVSCRAAYTIHSYVSPLSSELVDCVEDVDVRAWTGVDVVDDLVHTYEGSRPADPSTAVD